MTTNEPTNPDIKTKFKGPGEWRSQAKKLEEESGETDGTGEETPEE